MSSFALTAFAGISSSVLDDAFTLTTSHTGETNVQFGDGVHGAALPPWSGSMPQAIYAAGGGASGHAAAATPQLPEDRPLHSGYGEVRFRGEGGHFRGILMQQGRVQTDADYNEATARDWRCDLRQLGQNERTRPSDTPDPQRLDYRGATGSLQPPTGDEVLIAFEHGQMQRPYVAAPLWNSADKPPTKDGAAHAKQAALLSMSSHLDSFSEMGEAESIRLQMAMDRLSKMMSTLSNLLQRIETTDAAITQNIK